MIAKPNQHYRIETLSELLDDRLSHEEADQVQLHLDECETCRQQLATIAGQPDWWRETVAVLSESTVASPQRVDSIQGQTNLDASMQWLHPLLDSGDAGELGRIDEYPIHDVIGQGGMGVVLRGIDTDLSRPVAIKVLSPHLSGVGAARMRFMREARAAAAIVHPSIVPIYRIDTTRRLPYIVMPFIAGGNLQERIDQDGPLELVEVIRIALQVAEGIAAAHRHGVIHRDIKPANILVEQGNGRVLISDFGLARALDDATLTMSGMISGTPQFMSPEQAEGEAVDERTDLYSLGSLIYCMATGRAPFRAESPLAVLRKISESQPRPIQSINERMPAWLDTLVGRLMQPERIKRIQTADETIDIIRASLNHVRNPENVPLPLAIRSKQAARKRAYCVSAIITVIAMGVAGFAIHLSNGASPSRVKFVRVPSTGFQSSVPITESRQPQALDTTDLSWPGEFLDAGISQLNSELDGIAQSMGYNSHNVAPLGINFHQHVSTRGKRNVKN